MEYLIYKNDFYTIWRTNRDSLYDLATFVVKENEVHHGANQTGVEIFQDIERTYIEELSLSNSLIYVARDNYGNIIGSVRTARWDRHVSLPIKKMFGIDPIVTIGTGFDYWHVGRFAIKSTSQLSTIKLFKQLMVIAIQPIIMSENSCMIAETDSKLLKVMHKLGIITNQLADPINYLFSETIPIYSKREWLEPFYLHHKHLLLNEAILEMV